MVLASYPPAGSGPTLSRMPRWDGLKPLPDHAVAPLLRALMCIPRRPESRLILQPVNEARAPFWTTEGDYSVIWRSTKVGRISYDHKPYGHGTRLDARPYASRFGLRVLSLSCCGASFREAREKPSSSSRPPTPRRIRTAIRKYDARLAVFRLQLQQSRFAFRNGPAKKLRRVLDGPA